MHGMAVAKQRLGCRQGSSEQARFQEDRDGRRATGGAGLPGQAADRLVRGGATRNVFLSGSFQGAPTGG